MRDRVFALLVHDNPDCFEPLRSTLKELSVGTFSVRTCSEAARLIVQTEPCLIFTDASLPDGSWVDILNQAEAAEAPVCVVVVGTTCGGRLRTSTMRLGAFAFVAPPFALYSLGHIVHLARREVRNRREAMAHSVA